MCDKQKGGKEALSHNYTAALFYYNILCNTLWP